MRPLQGRVFEQKLATTLVKPRDSVLRTSRGALNMKIETSASHQAVHLHYSNGHS